MGRPLAAFIAIACLALAAPPAGAHHGWSTYDVETEIDVEAPIEASHFQNPHTEIDIEYQGKIWVVVLASPLRMLARGLTPEDLQPGTTVLLEGHPRRDGVPEIRAERITVNGKTVELEAGWYLALPSALYVSPLGLSMRDSFFLYPLTNVLHLIGLVLVVSASASLDLRLLGLARRFPIMSVYPLLTRVALLGLAVQLVTGFMLFASEAPALLRNDAFLLKMSLLVAALANAGMFRLLWRSRLATWDDRRPMPGLAQAALSLFLWLSIAVLGRLIAYV